MECEGSVPEFGLVYQSLFSPTALVEAQPYTLSIRIHQWHRNGGTQAFILQKPTFSLYLPPFHSVIFFGPYQPSTPTVHPPLLSPTPLIPPFPLPPISFCALRLPPPLKKEAFLTVTRTQSCMDRDHIVIQHQIVCVCVCVRLTYCNNS